MLKFLPMLALALTMPLAVLADDDDEEESAGALAGMLARENRETLPALTLASGVPLAEGPMRLRSGGYYNLPIEADGSAELQIVGPEFFRAIWINEVVINDIEIRPLGLDSIEFDDEGELRMSFIAIKPGSYAIYIPGTTGETQRVEIIIE